MRERLPACEVGLDGGDVDFAWRPIAVVGAEKRDVPHAGGLGLVKEGGDLAGVSHAHHRGDEIDAVRLRERPDRWPGSSQSKNTSLP